MSDVSRDPGFPDDAVPGEFPAAARAWIARLFEVRRDVRHFNPALPVAEETLRRVLLAAHFAPSVGFSQPWRFVLLRDRARRARIRESFLACRRAEAARFSAQRREQYLSLKLEGIVDAPLNLCVVADLRPQGEAILGTTVQPESVRASVLCAVQNLWLAARAEGLGVGWVSVIEPAVLRAELALPAGVEPVAYLCLGYPARPYLRPMLEEVGWKKRLDLDEVIREERWPLETLPCSAISSPVDHTLPGDHSLPGDNTLPSLATIPARDREQSEREIWSRMVVPPAACGRMQELATHWAVRRAPTERPKSTLLIFAADHGVTVEGVSAYGSVATMAVLSALMAEQSTAAVLAKRFDIPIMLCDVGTASDRTRLPRAPTIALLDRRVAAGTQNLRRVAAMSQSECDAALAVGRTLVKDAVASGINVIGLGEVGIGNTTCAAAITAALLGLDAGLVAGRGTGLDDETVSHKARVISDALTRLGTRLGTADSDPYQVLSELGGLEIAALCGAVLEAVRQGAMIVLDGAVTGAAALLAERIQPGVVDYCIASHCSAERCGQILLSALGLRPLLNWDLSLGEGAGAALGIDFLHTALSVRRAVATFPEVGIVDRARTGEILPRPVSE